MNVRLPSDPRPTAPAPKVDPVRSGRASAYGPQAEHAPASEASADDHVELSAAGRARAAQANASEAPSLEIEIARTALRAGSKLSSARIHELRERVRTGYYDTPSSVDRIGEAAARELLGAD